jgi:hypothetical protein
MLEPNGADKRAWDDDTSGFGVDEVMSTNLEGDVRAKLEENIIAKMKEDTRAMVLERNSADMETINKKEEEIGHEVDIIQMEAKARQRDTENQVRKEKIFNRLRKLNESF